MEKEVKGIYIEIPKGYEFDKIREDLGLICLKKVEINLTETIKTWEDVMNYMNIDKDFFSMLETILTKKALAFTKLTYICTLFNEGWEPDWSNDSQKKYMPSFQYKNLNIIQEQSLIATNRTFYPDALYLKSEEISGYVGSQFIDIYKDFLI